MNYLSVITEVHYAPNQALLLLFGEETNPISPDSSCLSSLNRAAASLIRLNSMQKA